MNKLKERTFTLNYLGKDLIVKTGKLATHNNFSCTVQYGDTVILATSSMSEKPKTDATFFPLMVEYEEKLYAAGKIKGSRFIKREGRPSDEAVLTSRLIDRGIRPLFPENLRNDVQVILTVLSYDEENLPDFLSIIGASIVLHNSSIPWNGPVAGVRVSYIDNKFVINPSKKEIDEKAEFNLLTTVSKDKILMIDADFKEIQESIVEEAFKKALEAGTEIINFIEEIRANIGKEKIEIPVIEPEINQNTFSINEQKEIENNLKEIFKPLWEKHLFNKPYGTKNERKEMLKVIMEEGIKTLKDTYEIEKIEYILNKYFIEWAEEEVTNAILTKSQRIDGRSLDDIRDLSAETGLLPKTHGSALFNRGETQVLSITTLGAPGAEQTLDTMEEDDSTKRYIHHYNFPPYATGEVKPIRGTNRREIGHGALAEKAILPVLPNKEEFPYTIRVVSETLSSNGSSSMASTCASSLALMDAGVPIKKHVAGIAIGLASDKNGNYKLITDIQDFEDGPGGMDFKVTGTRDGITAIQMDTKTNGLNMDIVKEALQKAKIARYKILDVLDNTISKPKELSPYAPRILNLKINPDKIGEIIGPGGKNIRQLTEKHNVSIDIEEDGSIFITSENQIDAENAKQEILESVKELSVGEIYTGIVSKILDFGAIVQITPNKDGMIHISELDNKRIEKVSDVLKIGDKVTVKIIRIDRQGKISLSRKALLNK